jgi:uncharacterized protein (DUF1778 family)
MATAARKPKSGKANQAATERLEARIAPEQKIFFQHAASLRGVSLKEFMVTSMREAAVKTIAEHELFTLTAQEQQVFVDTLLHPPSPNDALRAATERYGRMVGR